MNNNNTPSVLPLCAKLNAKLFTYIISFNVYNRPWETFLSLFLFHRG